ncbi:hypothetical protein PYCC9005_003540 [Savitreella phatthalungensis]
MAPQVLTVQSSVAYGHVGNRAAVLPIQLNGFDVCQLDTVQFATHTGYPWITGRRGTRDELLVLYEGLEKVGARGWTGFLTGYVPGVEGVRAVAEIAERISSGQDRPFWLLDPVMGDEERGLYVSDEIPPLYASMAPQADLITPNMFELELLAGIKVNSWATLQRAFEILHGKGVKRIVVTTFKDPSQPHEISVVVSSYSEAPFRVQVPFYDRPYQGTGDLFAALLLSHILKGQALRDAVLTALDTMKPILEDTGSHFEDAVGAFPSWREARMRSKTSEATDSDKSTASLVCRSCELRIVDNIKSILEPHAFYKAEALPKV